MFDKEKSDLQYTLDSEQKGIHARRDSDVRFNFPWLFLLFVGCWLVSWKRERAGSKTQVRWRWKESFSCHLWPKERREKSSKWTFSCLYGFFCPLPFRTLQTKRKKLPSSMGRSFFTHSPLFFFLFQAQIKILNLMDRKEKTAQALVKKKSSLMELEVQAQKVRLIFFSIAPRLLFLLSKCILCECNARSSFHKKF